MKQRILVSHAMLVPGAHAHPWTLRRKFRDMNRPDNATPRHHTGVMNWGWLPPLRPSR